MTPVSTLRRLTSTRLCTLLLGATLFTTACTDAVPTASVARPHADVTSGDGENTVLVGFSATPTDGDVAMIESLGGRVVHRYKYIPVVAVAMPADQAGSLTSIPTVSYVENDVALELYGNRQIRDWGVRKIDAAGAWSLGFTGKGVKVGIFDSGIDVDHPDLVVSGGIDLIEDGNGLDDCNGHGTHVAGIVGARDNHHSTVGVAPSAKLYSMRFFNCVGGGATLVRMLRGLEWAIDNQMSVINMSFGSVRPIVVAGTELARPADPLAENQSAKAMFQAAYDRGIVLIAASGNSGVPYVSYPAAYSTVVAVGATDDDDLLASFSQYGADQELTAPGVNVFASFIVGLGRDASLFVASDNNRELDAIPMAFAGLTSTAGMTTPMIAVGLGMPEDYQGVDCTGKTALISRGQFTFAQKVQNAMNAGCAAAVIHNNQPGNFAGTLGAPTAAGGQAWIPAASVALDDGLYLRSQIASKPTTTTLVNVVGNMATLSGTSMASPHATGVAALVRERFPTATPDQVRAVLRAGVDDLGSPGWDPVFGYGRVNARKAVSTAAP